MNKKKKKKTNIIELKRQLVEKRTDDLVNSAL